MEVEKKIEEKITQFIDRVEKHPNRKNQVRGCSSFLLVKITVLANGHSHSYIIILLNVYML